LVQRTKSNCLNGLQTRTETTTTIRRAAAILAGDKDSKASTIRLKAKNGTRTKRVDIVEFQL
jgi:hypothetical protein